MPVAEDLLGVRFDTEMLAKLALSVAGVLLVSWAYRFYSSRSRYMQQDGPGTQHRNRTVSRWGVDRGTSSEGSGDSCEEEPLCPVGPSPAETESGKPTITAEKSQNKPSRGETQSEQWKASPGEPQTEPLPIKMLSEQCINSPAEAQNDISLGENLSKELKISPEEPMRGFLGHVEPDTAIMRGEMSLNCYPDPPFVERAVQHDPTEEDRIPAADDHITQTVLSWKEAEGGLDTELALGSSLSPPPIEAQEQGGSTPTGRRSPCVLRRLEPSAGVGRELRQDLGHPGSLSYFLSKAEVRMEDGEFLLERDGDKPIEVRGRIYEYHVESSSQSISDEGPLDSPSTLSPVGLTISHDLQELKESDVGQSHGGAEFLHPSSPSLTQPSILQDLVGTTDPVQDPTTPNSPDNRTNERQRLVRKDSYMHIVENSDLQIPFTSPRVSTTRSPLSPLTPSSEDICFTPQSSRVLSRSTMGGTEPEEETGSSISLPPTAAVANSISPELDSLQRNLDLGNCLHALNLARKQGHSGLQRAALKVMSDNYLQVLQDPALYGSLRGGDRDLIQKLRVRGKRCLVVADLDPQDWAEPVLEPSTSRTSSSLYYYDDCKDIWNHLCALPKEVVSRGSAMCVMDNYLFVTVGCQGLGREVQPSRRAFCYNPSTSIWREISPMNEARPQCKLVALGGHVYAIGGECLSSVERYDPRTDRWTFVAPMPNDTFAVAHRATVCNGELFVSGGTLKYTLLRYNPATNAWKRSIIVGSKERTAEMVAVRNFLYRFDVGTTPVISVYRYHVAARLWYECCSKQLPHCSSFQCAVMDDIIYCVSKRSTMRFMADEVSPDFIAEDLSVLSAAKGTLLPLILVLPEGMTLQTRV